MTKSEEIESINTLIIEKFGVPIIDTWIPAEGYYDRACLFVMLKDQEVLSKKYKDLEYEVFRTVKEFFKHSLFFDCIALL